MKKIFKRIKTLIDAQLEKLTLGKFQEKAEKVCLHLRLVSAEELEELADGLLCDKQDYKSIRSAPTPAERSMTTQLGPVLKRLCEEYEYLHAEQAHFLYVRSKMGPSEYAQGYIRIGWTMDYVEVAVRPGDDRMFELDGVEDGDNDPVAFKTILHWLIFQQWLVTRDDSLIPGLTEDKNNSS